MYNKVGGEAVMRCICLVCVMVLGMEPRAFCVHTRLLFFLCGEIADLQSDSSGQSPILALGMLHGSRETLTLSSGSPLGKQMWEAKPEVWKQRLKEAYVWN